MLFLKRTSSMVSVFDLIYKIEKFQKSVDYDMLVKRPLMTW
jgi:hypothetical protein